MLTFAVHVFRHSDNEKLEPSEHLKKILESQDSEGETLTAVTLERLPGTLP